MTSVIQGQLFTILNETSRESKSVPCLITGTFHICHLFKLCLSVLSVSQFPNACVFLGGHYAGVDTIKTRLLPWLGTWFSHATSGRLFETGLFLNQVGRKLIFKGIVWCKFDRVLWLGCSWTWWSLRSFPTWVILWFYDSVIFTELFRNMHAKIAMLLKDSARYNVETVILFHCRIQLRQRENWGSWPPVRLYSCRTCRKNWLQLVWSSTMCSKSRGIIWELTPHKNPSPPHLLPLQYFLLLMLKYWKICRIIHFWLKISVSEYCPFVFKVRNRWYSHT